MFITKRKPVRFTIVGRTQEGKEIQLVLRENSAFKKLELWVTKKPPAYMDVKRFAYWNAARFLHCWNYCLLYKLI